MFQIGLYIHCRMYPSNSVEQISPVHFAPKDQKENKIFKDTFEHILENNHLSVLTVIKGLVGMTILEVIFEPIQESTPILVHIVLKDLNVVVIIENTLDIAILKK